MTSTQTDIQDEHSMQTLLPAVCFVTHKTQVCAGVAVHERQLWIHADRTKSYVQLADAGASSVVPFPWSLSFSASMICLTVFSSNIKLSCPLKESLAKS